MRSKPAALYFLGVAAAATVLVALIGGGLAEGHEGHPQKKLFEERWYHQVQGDDYAGWMTLGTSEFWYECGASEADCESRWGAPGQNAVDDWNTVETTVRLNQLPTQTMENDFNIYFQDDVLGDPSLLGIMLSYDENEDLCFASCEVHFVDVRVGDAAHSGAYDTLEERQGTVAHEIGHGFGLRHESVNADESELYDCGIDDTGEIPVSIMSYNCIDPAPFGQGVFEVQPWDVCGVNHAYFDPTIGFAGCDGLGGPSPSEEPSPTEEPTPTDSPGPTPGDGEVLFGDVDCNGNPNPVDALKMLRTDAGLPVNQPSGCPQMGEPVTIDGTEWLWGDIGCNGVVDPVDSLLVLRFDAGLVVNQPQGCPVLGDPVTPS